MGKELKHAILNSLFKIAEIALRFGATYIVYVAALRTVEHLQQGGQSVHILEAIALVSLPILMAWQSKHIASSIVDIVRKPLFEGQ